ncbi:HNH endonuclease [Nocardia sp. NPDC051833]|uniref:HNH endonuclease n=1 Tax=Nocardia sp. NPDC051833 TaxID=3155674 RepID=UPI0034382BF0
MDLEAELAFREQIFNQLAEQLAVKPVLQRRDLEYFELDGAHRRIADRSKGIWNPRDLMATLSILSTPDSSYPDVDLGDGLFAYAYREGSTDGDNAKLRRAFELKLPLIWHRGFKDRSAVRYRPVFPVHIVEDDPENRRVIISLDTEGEPIDLDGLIDDPEIKKQYSVEKKRRRLHQRKFRSRLLVAYQWRCAVCRLDFPPLLDGAHIIGDTESDGNPVVDNGLALCKIHHAAYDADLLGISPDYRVHISAALRESTDSGPVIAHGFRELDGHPLAVLPDQESHRPSKDRLGLRFERFAGNIDVAWLSHPVQTSLASPGDDEVD